MAVILAGVSSTRRGLTTGSSRVVRGGYWLDYAGLCRSAYRFTTVDPNGRNYSVGLRGSWPQVSELKSQSGASEPE
jgi:formylglycine-generating enzyme required for sulfatase activity